jgi:RNA recognition motif-containing protein
MHQNSTHLHHPAKNPAAPQNIDDNFRLFVGGLPSQVTETQLFDYFSRFGLIEWVLIKRDKKRGYSKGYGFITCSHLSTKRKILGMEHTIEGKLVDVNLATPKKKSDNFKSELYKRKIYIPDLEFGISEEDLAGYFSQFGKVNKVYKVIDTLNNFKKKSIGYVEFAEQRVREEVLDLKDGHKIGHSSLNCRRYCPVGWNPVPNKVNAKFENQEQAETADSEGNGLKDKNELNGVSSENEEDGGKDKRKEEIKLRYEDLRGGEATKLLPFFKDELECGEFWKNLKHRVYEDLWNGNDILEFDFGKYQLKIELGKEEMDEE